MATYSAAPGISVVGVLTTPAEPTLGTSDSNTYTVPANSYAIISIYSERNISYNQGTSTQGVTSSGGSSSTFDGNATGMILGQSIVVGGEDIVATHMNLTVGTQYTKISVSGKEIFKDADRNEIKVHYVVFS